MDLSTKKLGGLHLKAHSIASMCFGFPLALILCIFIELPLVSILKIVAIYLGVWAVVFIPFFYLVPRLFFSKDEKKLKKKNHSLDDNYYNRLLERLINYPIRSSLIYAIGDFFGFSFGATLSLLLVFPPDPILLSVIFPVVYAIALVVAIIDGYVNYSLIDNYVRPVIETIVEAKPQLRQRNLNIKKVPYIRKVFAMVFVSTLAAQLSLFLIFIGKFAIRFPEEASSVYIYIVIIWLLTFIYLVVISRLVAHTLSDPLHKLINWSKTVISGNLDARLNLITNDELDEVVIYSNNMAQQLAQERDIIEAEEKKHMIMLSNVFDGVIAVDPQFNIISINKSAEAMLGKKKDKVNHTPIAENLFLINQNKEDVNIKDILKDKKLFIDKKPYTLKNLKLNPGYHQPRDVVLYLAAIEETGVTKIKYIVTLHDVTEEKELERMKLDFVSMAAHELRTPLTSIQGYLSFMRDENTLKKLADEEKEFINRAAISSLRLSQLIENLLVVSRIEKGEVNLNKQPLQLDELVEKLVEDFIPLAKVKNLELKFIPPTKSIPVVLADPLRLNEVVNNLVGNAINYTQKGSVTVEVLPDKSGVVFSVTDTGEGIPKDAMPHLFTKFFRIKGDLESGSKGTGLGLFISKNIIEQHGGKIWCESKFGKGSTFYFSLPVNNSEI